LKKTGSTPLANEQALVAKGSPAEAENHFTLFRIML
jgi:hypothetical protein